MSTVTDQVQLIIKTDRFGNEQHWYQVDGQDLLLPSVTHILKGTMNWAVVKAAAKEVAWACVRGRKMLYAISEETSEEAAVEVFKDVFWKAWDAKRDMGVSVHAVVATGSPYTEAERPYIEQYQRWLDEYHVEVVAQEVAVASLKHGYGGKLDLVARLRHASFEPRTLVVDIKVRNDLRVFPERLVQSAGYAKAEIGMPCEIDGAAVLTLGKEGYSFVEVEDLDAALSGFLGLRAWAEYLGKTEAK